MNLRKGASEVTVASKLTCPAGHSWISDAPSSACPTCGAAATPPTHAPSVSGFDLPAPADFSQEHLQARKLAGYTILREHAAGGLGHVFVARDQALRRDVALKQIKPHIDHDPNCRRRFLNEAIITGQLEHPGIVPVYAMGFDADGRPYYAMKFVRGQTLETAIGEYHGAPEPQKFRELLRRFVSVCQAIAYSHSRGVIHRDLKPSNVMIGEFEQTVILDWGLAKRVGSPDAESSRDAPDSAGADATLDGQIVGTPLYMSPEQAGGDAARHGPASDIYALGAILYQLLSGRAAHGGSTNQEIVQHLRDARPLVPPSKLKRGVSKALEAVCLKAMSAGPSDRYPSADEMARQVERWLADEPVDAYREPVLSRLARLSRRHKSVFVGALLVVLVLTIGVVATGWQMIRATRAEARAQSRFNDVRALANRFMLDFNTQIQNLAGSTPAQRMLVETSLEYLNKLAADSDDDPELQRELATAYEKVGNIQGNRNAGNNLGDTAGALASYQKGLDIMRRLHATGHGKSPREITLLLSRIADVRESRGETAQSIEIYRQVLAEFERALGAGPATPELMRDLSVTHARLGDLHGVLGQNDAAAREFETSLDYAARRAQLDPSNRLAQIELTLPEQRLAGMKLRRGDASGALTHYQNATKVLREASSKSPDDAEVRFLLAGAIRQLGQAHSALRSYEPAIDAYEEALAIARSLGAADPRSSRYQQDLYQSYAYLGNLYVNLDKPAEAERTFRAMLGSAQAQVELDPSNPMLRRLLGLAHQDLARILWVRGDKSGTLEYFTQSLAEMKIAADRDPQSVRLKRDLWISYSNLGDFHRKMMEDDSLAKESRRENADRAIARYDEALAVLNDMGDGRVVEHGDETVPDEIRAFKDACAKWLAANP